jgi:anti-sigma B factor antagonist
LEGTVADAWPSNVPLDIGVRPVRDGVTLVTVAGEIDIATAPRLRVVLAPLSTDESVRLLVCDLSRVTFLSCGGMSTLFQAHHVTARRGARLRVVATEHAVRRPLAVTGLLAELAVTTDLGTALA